MFDRAGPIIFTTTGRRTQAFLHAKGNLHKPTPVNRLLFKCAFSLNSFFFFFLNTPRLLSQLCVSLTNLSSDQLFFCLRALLLASVGQRKREMAKKKHTEKERNKEHVNRKSLCHFRVGALQVCFAAATPPLLFAVCSGKLAGRSERGRARTVGTRRRRFAPDGGKQTQSDLPSARRCERKSSYRHLRPGSEWNLPNLTAVNHSAGGRAAWKTK